MPHRKDTNRWTNAFINFSKACYVWTWAWSLLFQL